MLKKHKIVKLQEYFYILDENATIVEGNWYLENNQVWQDLGEHSISKHYKIKSNCKKVIATTDKFLNCKQIESCSKSLSNKCICPNKLPQIPTSFLQEYIKSPVDEVEVEYEEFIETKEYGQFGGKFESVQHINLKLTHNNEIIISPIETKLYTKEEVVKLLNFFFIDIARYPNTQESVNEWIKENLK